MSWDQVNLFIESVVSIFAIVTPGGNLPIFLSLTEDASPRERQRVFRLATLVAFGIVAAMALVGQYLLWHVFHITFDEFRFGGGLILIVVGIRRILARPERHGATAVDPASRESEQIRLAVSPIASPLLVGPGTIVTVMLVVNRATGSMGFLGGELYALSACLINFVLVGLVLNWSHLAYRFMGRIGATAVGRVMDIFIVAIGVKFIFDSVAAFVQTVHT